MPRSPYTLTTVLEPGWRDAGLESDIKALASEIHGPDSIPNFSRSNSHWSAGFEGDSFVSYAGFEIDPETQIATFCGAGVLPSFRQSGRYGALLAHRLKAARKAGATEAQVGVSSGSKFITNRLFRSGFRVFEPEQPWLADVTAIYLKKTF